MPLARLWPEANAAEETWATTFLEGSAKLANFEEPAALALLTQALAGCALHPNPARASVLDALVETHFLMNDYHQALATARDAHATWNDLKDPALAADALAWSGACLVQLARYREGLEVLHSALDQFTALDLHKRGARAHNYLAVVHEELGDFDRAFEAYALALDCAEADDDTDMKGRVLANWGDAHVAQGTADLGLPLLERAVEVLRSINAHWHYGWCLASIGRVHRQRGDFDRAHLFCREALAAVERGHAPRSRVEVYAGLGDLLCATGGTEEGLAFLNRALAEATRLGIQRERYQTHRLLSEAYKRLGDFEQALKHHEAFFEVRSSVFDEVAREKMATVKAEFELQRVQQARELERSQSIELAVAYARLAEQAEQLARLSSRDGLTGLFNRRHFDDALTLELQRARAFGAPLSLALVDADNFKAVNDQRGHVIGDVVLKTLAAVMMRELRQSDLATRYGGEEFALILAHTSIEGAKVAAEKIRAAIECIEWSEMSEGLRVTVSVGVAQWVPGESPVQLVQRADHALYDAKSNGRNRVGVAVVPNASPTLVPSGS